MMIRSRLYDLNNPKDVFIVEKLLPSFLDRLDRPTKSDDTVHSIASLPIFPYKAPGGTRLGSLSEQGVRWYFTGSDSMQATSQSYRILDESVMKPDDARRFRHVFSENKLIREYSPVAVIGDLIDTMSSETEYSERWWNCAYDIFTLWNPKGQVFGFDRATTNIKNNCFLFLKDSYPNELREKLIHYGVFRDVLTNTAQRFYLDKIPASEKSNAIRLLQLFNIPHSFVVRSGSWSQKVEINESLKNYILSISKDMCFPVAKDDDHAEKCALCHELFWNYIFLEAGRDLSDIVQKLERGILIRNVSQGYVPLAWDLFYSSSNWKSEAAGEICICGADSEDASEMPECHGDFETLHVDVAAYEKGVIEQIKTLHEFCTVSKTYGDYHFGIIGEEMEFYKWLWRYTHHRELIHNILCCCSGKKGEPRETLPSNDISFILSVLSRAKEDSESYRFDIDFHYASGAFDNAPRLNQIAHSFDDIKTVVYGNVKRLSVTNYIEQLLKEANTVEAEKQKISNDDLWDHVYIIGDDPNQYEGQYLKTNRYENKTYESVILLWASDDEGSYRRALARYINDHYRASIYVPDAPAINWREEYRSLVLGVRQFLTETHPQVDPDTLFGNIANLADVRNYGEERHLWQQLKKEEDRIVNSSSISEQLNLENWRTFLFSKYKGRCQLCGGKSSKNEQDALYWTYRIVTESKNKLANIKSNLFCLCPSCHGEMRYGNYMGKDLSDLVDKLHRYADYFHEKEKTGEMEDGFPTLIEEIADDSDTEDFAHPIICKVIVNGKPRNMVFSWEHFIRLAHLFTADVNEDMN